MRIKIEASNVAEAQRMYADMSRRIADPRPEWGAIRPILWEGEKKIFQRRGSIIGKAWPALRPRTLLLRKKGAGSGRKPLFATGKLFESLTGSGAGALWKPGQGEVRFGTTVFYAKFNRSKRPMVGVPRKELRLIARKIGDWIVGG